MFRFKYAGRREEESLDLVPRILREIGPVIEDRVSSEVGWAKVERGAIGHTLVLKVSPKVGTMDVDRKVTEEVGRVILDEFMNIATYNATAPVITASGNLASGGRISADRIGL